MGMFDMTMTEEQTELVPYRLCSYPHDAAAVRQWLRQI